MRIAVMDHEAIARTWWAVLLRGVAGIAFGVVTFLSPGISLAALVLLFGAYAFADGVLALVSAARHRGRDGRAWTVFDGVAGVAAGVLTLVWPGITALVLLYVVAAWALVTGGFEIAAAIRLRKSIHHEWLLALGGAASVALGILLLVFPGPGALALVLWIGAYALVFGTVLVVLGLRLRSWGRTHTPTHAHPAVA